MLPSRSDILLSSYILTYIHRHLHRYLGGYAGGCKWGFLSSNIGSNLPLVVFNNIRPAYWIDGAPNGAQTIWCYP